MATPFLNSSIRFKISYNISESAKTLTFLDMLWNQYAALGITVSQVKGLVRMTDPDGVVFKLTQGFNTSNPDFSNPDINGNTAKWSITNIAAPLDQDQKIKLGRYVFEYILSVNGGTSFWYYSMPYDYRYQSPCLKIHQRVLYKTLQLRSEDATEYAINLKGIEYLPITLNRTHTVVKPAGAGCTDPGSTSDAIRFIGGGSTIESALYTNWYTTLINTQLSYRLANWITTPWIEVNDVLDGSRSIRVNKSDCLCGIADCIAALTYKYSESLKESRSKSDAYRDKVLMLLAADMNLNIAEQCGKEVTPYVRDIKRILLEHGYVCAQDNDNAPSEPLFGVGSSSEGGSASTFNFGSGLTDPTGGGNGDYYWQGDQFPSFSHLYLWKKVNGSWSNLGDCVPTVVSNPSLNSSLVQNDLTSVGTSAGLSEEVLGSHSIDSSKYANVQDLIHIEGVGKFAQNDHAKTVRVYMDSTLLDEFVTDKIITIDNNLIAIVINVSRTGESTVLVESRVMTRNFISIKQATVAYTDASIVKIVGLNSQAQANDIALTSFSVEYKNFAPISE